MIPVVADFEHTLHAHVFALRRPLRRRMYPLELRESGSPLSQVPARGAPCRAKGSPGQGVTPFPTPDWVSEVQTIEKNGAVVASFASTRLVRIVTPSVPAGVLVRPQTAARRTIDHFAVEVPMKPVMSGVSSPRQSSMRFATSGPVPCGCREKPKAARDASFRWYLAPSDESYCSDVSSRRPVQEVRRTVPEEGHRVLRPSQSNCRRTPDGNVGSEPD